MPTYDYVCSACGHAFEHFQSLSDKRLRKCPACGKPRLERQFGTGIGVVFKGSGFYETDYKDRKGTPDTPPKDGGGSKDGSGGSSKGDASGSKDSKSKGSTSKGSSSKGSSSKD